ncbi:unnamed protein product [Sphacelaria rigidula]
MSYILLFLSPSLSTVLFLHSCNHGCIPGGSVKVRQSINYSINQMPVIYVCFCLCDSRCLSASLPICLPACPPARLPTRLPACLSDSLYTPLVLFVFPSPPLPSTFLNPLSLILQ